MRKAGKTVMYLARYANVGKDAITRVYADRVTKTRLQVHGKILARKQKDSEYFEDFQKALESLVQRACIDLQEKTKITVTASLTLKSIATLRKNEVKDD